MKLFIFLFVLFIASLFGMAGCGDKSRSEPGTSYNIMSGRGAN